LNRVNGLMDNWIFGDPDDSPREIQNYLGRVSGPLLDRIDLHVEVPQVKFSEMSGEPPPTFSGIILRIGLGAGVKASGLNDCLFKDCAMPGATSMKFGIIFPAVFLLRSSRI